MTGQPLRLRRHVAGDTRSEALYSPCDGHRYRLTRRWGEGAALAFVMLNPSTATEAQNDPTIERCERRARAMGFAALDIVNLFSWRATRPADLRRATAPWDAQTDVILAQAARQAGMVVAAWGVHGAHLGRNRAVLPLLDAPLHHLGLTRDGHPRHPLYVPYSVLPQIWCPA